MFWKLRCERVKTKLFYLHSLQWNEFLYCGFDLWFESDSKLVWPSFLPKWMNLLMVYVSKVKCLILDGIHWFIFVPATLTWLL